MVKSIKRIAYMNYMYYFCKNKYYRLYHFRDHKIAFGLQKKEDTFRRKI